MSRSTHARDWVVDWRACVDPDADNVEVDSSHVDMCAHAQVYELLGERLAALAASAPSDLAATRLTATAELGSLTAARCRSSRRTSSP